MHPGRHALPIATDHPAFEGHFPGNPILPGVVLLAEVIEFVRRQPEHAALVEGHGLRIGVAKFLRPVRPGDPLEVELRVQRGALRFEVWQGLQLAASGLLETGRSAVADPP